MAIYPYVCTDCNRSATDVRDGEHHCPKCGDVVPERSESF